MDVYRGNMRPIARPAFRLEIVAPQIVAAFAMAAVTSSLFIASRIAEALPAGDALRGLAIGITIVAVLYGALASFVERETVAGLVSIGLLLSIWFYVWTFNSRIHVAFSPAAGGLYFPIALVGLFVAVVRLGKLDAVLRFTVLATIGYALLYLLLDRALAAGMLHWIKGSQLLIDADATSQRGARVVLATSFAIFALLVSTARFRTKPSIGSALPIALMLVVLWISRSRTILLITGVVWAAYVVTRRPNLIAIVSLIVFLVGAAGSLAIAFSPGMNPMEAFHGDQSGDARALSISIVQSMVPSIWTIGSGIASGLDGYFPLTRSYVFQPSDVGMLGILFMFGIGGFAFYVGLAVAACRSWRVMPRFGIEPAMAEGLGLTGAVTVVYSLLAATFAGGSGAMFAALFLAFATMQADIGLERYSRRQGSRYF